MKSPTSEAIPSRGLAAISIILSFLVLLALYANVQKLRRDRIETVTVTTVATPTPSPAP